jgi:hypothetical protein
MRVMAARLPVGRGLLVIIAQSFSSVYICGLGPNAAQVNNYKNERTQFEQVENMYRFRLPHLPSANAEGNKDSINAGAMPMFTKVSENAFETVWEGESTMDWFHQAGGVRLVAFVERGLEPNFRVQIRVDGATGTGWTTLSSAPVVIAQSAKPSGEVADRLRLGYRLNCGGVMKPGTYTLNVAFNQIIQ